jgi:hypothetical protein
MKDSYYFSHDYNTREDEKIKELIYKFGMEGYGVFWAIVESLYQNDGYMQTHYERIAFDMRTDIKIIESIINDFGLFKFAEDKFYSESISHRLKERRGKSIQARKSAEARWHKGKQKDANAMRTQCDSNAIKERKGKEIKEKERINIGFDVFWNLYDKKIGAKEKCEAKWNKLKDTERQKIIDTLPEFKKVNPHKQFVPYPETYLNQKRWNDVIETKSSLPSKNLILPQ